MRPQILQCDQAQLLPDGSGIFPFASRTDTGPRESMWPSMMCRRGWRVYIYTWRAIYAAESAGVRAIAADDSSETFQPHLTLTWRITQFSKPSDQPTTDISNMKAHTNQHSAAASPPTSPCLCPSTTLTWIHPRRIWKVCACLCAPLVQYENTALQSSVAKYIEIINAMPTISLKIGDDLLLPYLFIFMYI